MSYRIRDLPIPMTTAEIRRLAVAAEACPHSIARVIAGHRVRGMVDARIRRVLVRHGYPVPDLSPPPPPEAA